MAKKKKLLKVNPDRPFPPPLPLKRKRKKVDRFKNMSTGKSKPRTKKKKSIYQRLKNWFKNLLKVAANKDA